MDPRRTVDDFLHLGEELFRLMQADSNAVLDPDLQRMRSQLHLLEIQISTIQALRELRLKKGETTTYLEKLRSGD
jgi:hypothetical protein